MTDEVLLSQLDCIHLQTWLPRCLNTKKGNLCSCMVLSAHALKI